MADYLAKQPRIGNAPHVHRTEGRTAALRHSQTCLGGPVRGGRVRGLHLHDLRHLGLTEVARVVKNPKDIQDRAGHASITSTHRYLHTDEERDAEVADLVSARLARR